MIKSDKPYSTSRLEKPLNKAIKWARSLSDREIATILGSALMGAGAKHPKDTHVSLQYELIHEIKFRFERFERVPRHRDDHDYEEDDAGSED